MRAEGTIDFQAPAEIDKRIMISLKERTTHVSGMAVIT